MNLRTISLMWPRIAAAAVLGLGLTAAAAEVRPAADLVREEVVHERTTRVRIELNSRTVLCSAADYQTEMLKIVIPQLAVLTVLNHRNTNANGPCVSAGVCRAPEQEGLSPEDILKPDLPEFEEVPIHVKLTRVTLIYANRSTCDVRLREEVRVIVRGIPFYHVRELELEPRLGGDCV